jgi:hypothetical protein
MAKSSVGGFGRIRAEFEMARGGLEALGRHPLVLASWMAVVWALPVAVKAATAQWGASELTNITSGLTDLGGPVSVIALAAGGVGLAFGRDFGQLAQSASYVAVIAGVVGAAGSIMNTSGAMVP